MKTMMKSLVVAGILFLAAIPIKAASLTATISTSAATSGSFMLFPKESLSYSAVGTATGTIVIERSQNLIRWRPTNVRISAAGPVNQTGVISSGNSQEYYRFRLDFSTTNAQSVVVTFADRDDFVQEFKNNKGVATLRLYDDSIVANSNLSVVAHQVSTAATSGNSFGNSAKAYLWGTTAALEGSLLIATAPVAGYGYAVTVSTGDHASKWVGIAKAATSAGGIVDVYFNGFVLARTTGTVNAGDILSTSALSAGHLTGVAVPQAGADVGIALSNGNAAGGLTKIRLR